MGYMQHHAIIVTTSQKTVMNGIFEKATGLFPVVSPIMPSKVNGYLSIFIPPDGSKEGWEESNRGDEAAREFLLFLKKAQEENYGINWVMVQYGDDEKNTCIIDDSDADYRAGNEPKSYVGKE